MSSKIYCPECGNEAKEKKFTYNHHIFHEFYCKVCDHYFSICIHGRTKEKIEDLMWENASEM